MGFRPSVSQIEGFGLLSSFSSLRGLRDVRDLCFQDTQVGRGQWPSGKSREKSREKGQEKVGKNSKRRQNFGGHLKLKEQFNGT